MSVLDDLRDLDTGRIRVETGPYTDRERRKIRMGAPVVAVGFITLALSGDYLTMTFAMALAGVFARVLVGSTNEVK